MMDFRFNRLGFFISDILSPFVRLFKLDIHLDLLWRRMVPVFWCARPIVLLLVTAVASFAEEPAKEASLLLGRLLSRAGLSLRVFDRGSVRHRLENTIGCGRWRSDGRRAQSKDLGDDAPVIGESLIAGLLRLRSGNERHRVILRAGGGRNPVGQLVQRHFDYAGRRREVPGVGILRQLHGALHELSPDGRSRRAATELEVRVVVVAYPDDAQQVGGIAGKPGVM